METPRRPPSFFRRLGLACSAAQQALCDPQPLESPAAAEDVQAETPVSNDQEEVDLRRQINEARANVEVLKAAYVARCQRPLQPFSPPSSPAHRALGPPQVKIFIDGVFDLMHFGHMNAFRQARSLGTYLVVGVNSDETVASAKGSLPILRDAERQAAVAACRFVDEIVPASPYVMSAEYIEELIEKYHIDYFVHGDDPCIVDGKDIYEGVKKAGRYKGIPRTDGVSTTDIAGRTLLLSKEHHMEISPGNRPRSDSDYTCISKQSQFLVTSQLVRSFSAALPQSSATSSDRIVYIDGAWDMFHCGHIALLKRARELGNKIVVGVHSDKVVNQQRGYNYPILSMNERVLSVLGCRYVDDVLLDAPWHITEEMVATLRIAVVVRGSIRDCATCLAQDPRDPHEVPISLGIHQELKSDASLTIEEIVARLQQVRLEAEKRLAAKQQKERAWYCEKHGLSP